MRPVKPLLPLSALGALACSVALDFDRQYAGVDEVFPLQDLADLAGTPAGATREPALSRCCCTAESKRTTFLFWLAKCPR